MDSIASSRISSKGQVVIPKEVREAKHWQEGQEILFINTPQGVLLRPKSPFPPRTLEEVKARRKPYNGPWIPEEQWEELLTQAMREEWEK
jgi:AbrB family looped-hinge helix DNA binding protein